MTWQQVDKVENAVLVGGLAEDPPVHEEFRTQVAEVTTRLPVPGGWLYRVTRYNGDELPDTVAICFVPDEKERT